MRVRQDGAVDAEVSLEDQRVSFEGFLEIACDMGARHLRDGDARILGEGDRRAVVLFFSHVDFPGARFG
jgi:hypothetical protein